MQEIEDALSNFTHKNITCKNFTEPLDKGCITFHAPTEIYHLMPDDDVAHNFSRACWCRPRLEKNEHYPTLIHKSYYEFPWYKRMIWKIWGR